MVENCGRGRDKNRRASRGMVGEESGGWEAYVHGDGREGRGAGGGDGGDDGEGKEGIS